MGILELSSNSSICSASAVCRYFYVFFLGWCGVIGDGTVDIMLETNGKMYHDNKVTVIM